MTVTRKTWVSKHTDEEAGFASPGIDLEWYFREVVATDKLPAGELHPVLMGLFGEVGGILATLKKRVRDQDAYSEYDEAVEEEFGDALWYFAALCRRLRIPMDYIVAAPPTFVENGDPALPTTLLELGTATAALLRISSRDKPARELLLGFWARYMAALQAANCDLLTVAKRNLHKACGRFVEPVPARLPRFDEAFPPDERIPESFEITVRQRASGQTCLQWNGVFIGAPLTDNIAESDGYRYHDVFHLAHAAILHWSPTFRSLIKHKRKTSREVDEAQDGGRAIVVEEGLTAWVFSRAKQLDFFARQSSLSFDLLKTVGQFVRGYEVEECPLSLWEKAILRGYDVFRQVRAGNGGVIVGDRGARTIEYRPLTAGR